MTAFVLVTSQKLQDAHIRCYAHTIQKINLENKINPNLKYEIYKYTYIQNLIDRFLKFSGHFFPFINWFGECRRFDCTTTNGSHGCVPLQD